MFKKVAIIGTGLIGASLGLALKKKGLAGEIIGVSRHNNSLAIARRNRAIDRGSLNLNIIREADLVILATPVKTIISLAPAVARIIKPSCIVTDVGSTKKEIVSKLDRLFTFYLGSHPLAGSEKRGVNHANGELFKNSICILTPTRETRRIALRKIKTLWKRLGSKVLCFSPDEHDRILSFASHLPHLLAFSLIRTVPQGFLRFSGGGLRDTTRIAASDSQVWSDVFLTNRKHLLKALAALEKELSRMKKYIRNKDNATLARMLKDAKGKRDSL